MGRRHCAVPQYGFQASGTADTEGGAQEKAGRLHPSLGMGGGLQQAQDRDKGGKAGLATLGAEGDRDGPRSMPSGGLGGRLPCSPTSSTSSTEQTRNHRLSGAPTLSSPVFFSVVGAHPSPPPLPRGTHSGPPCSGRLRLLSHPPQGPLWGYTEPVTGLGPVSPQPPRAPATAAGSERTEPGRDPPPLSQTRVRARKTLRP